MGKVPLAGKKAHSETPPAVQQPEMEQPMQAEGTTRGPISLLDKAEEYLNANYDFRRNVVTEKTEFSAKGKGKYVCMRDRDYNTLYRKLQKEVGKLPTSDLRSLLNSDFVNQYNPFVEYVGGLPAWDGKTDHIQDLAKTVQTTDDPFWHECFKRWFVALLACATVDNITNHTVIVFSGKQGVGKTTWHMNLVPPALSDYRYSGTIKPHNKDTSIYLSECMLINLDELESLNRSEIGDLKEMITKGHIRLRRPYGHNSENLIRRASFVGSVNKGQFLTDATGSRRFLCFEVLDIDKSHKVNLDLAFAQAKHLLDSGYRFWFDDVEIAKITKSNEKFQVLSMEEELLLEHFEPTRPGEKGTVYTTTELATLLTSGKKIGLSDGFVNRLGKALNKHKFKRIKRGSVYAYVVKAKQP